MSPIIVLLAASLATALLLSLLAGSHRRRAPQPILVPAPARDVMTRQRWLAAQLPDAAARPITLPVGPGGEGVRAAQHLLDREAA